MWSCAVELAWDGGLKVKMSSRGTERMALQS
jgi:hypothetical protein